MGFFFILLSPFFRLLQFSRAAEDPNTFFEFGEGLIRTPDDLGSRAGERYSHRRSIYGYIDRANVPELLTQFDFANPIEPNTRRSSTIVPQQSLFLMNSPFTIAIVRRIMARDEVKAALAAEQDEDVIRAVYRVVFQLTPNTSRAASQSRPLRKEIRPRKSIATAIPRPDNAIRLRRSD